MVAGGGLMLIVGALPAEDPSLLSKASSEAVDLMDEGISVCAWLADAAVGAGFDFATD